MAPLDVAVSAFFFLASTQAALDCSAPRDSGFACSGGSPRFSFFYDSRSKQCQPFQYKGCGGNDNRFNSRQECIDGCKSPKNSSASASTASSSGWAASAGSQWLQADRCGSNFLIPNHKYTECPSGSGCPSEHTCQGGICCPSKKYVCSLLDDTGSFAEGIDDKPRFAWSDKVKSCIRFSYYGANGNYNNFPNFYSCMRFCSS